MLVIEMKKKDVKDLKNMLKTRKRLQEKEAAFQELLWLVVSISMEALAENNENLLGYIYTHPQHVETLENIVGRINDKEYILKRIPDLKPLLNTIN